MRILAIETSCDETALAIVDASGLRETTRGAPSGAPEFKVFRNDISSQVEVHRPFGGVVPNLAKREHLKNLPVMYAELGRDADDVDALAVTVGPGLAPALWTGIEFAREKAKQLGVPLIGTNHMEGHLYSNWLRGSSHNLQTASNKVEIGFPAVALVVSGGHTILLVMESLTKWKKLGETRDDAVGEAFDKVARLLGLPYPGGPEIEKLATTGDPKAIAFPRPMINDKNYDFSFSGLKTAVLYHLRDNPTADRADVAASFQSAAVEVLRKKALRAVDGFRGTSLLLCGGVAANKALRTALATEAYTRGIGFFAPEMQFNTDNAAMIAAAAYIQQAKGRRRRIMAQPNITL